MWVCYLHHYKGVPCPGWSGEAECLAGLTDCIHPAPLMFIYPPGPREGPVPTRIMSHP